MDVLVSVLLHLEKLRHRARIDEEGQVAFSSASGQPGGPQPCLLNRKNITFLSVINSFFFISYDAKTKLNPNFSKRHCPYHLSCMFPFLKNSIPC